MNSQALRKRINYLLIFFIAALLLSGLTAIPLKTEIDYLQNVVAESSIINNSFPALIQWISFVHQGITEMDQKYPFMFYGTDWLAFGHIVIAIAFLGALREPVKNIWIIEFGMIACLLVIPYALIFGAVRGIPFYWRVIDCSFGIIGLLPLWLARKYVYRIISRS